MVAKVRLLGLVMETYGDIATALQAFIASQGMKVVW
jgi:hypothetical protein